jgi:outer membrane protein assembly factor BamB
MSTRCLLSIFVFGSALALSAGAADWPQWRGPRRDGVSEETGLLKEWPKGGPKLLWQVKDIGYGFATPAVAGDRIFVISNKGQDDEFVQALSINDGKQIWSARVGKVGPNQMQPYPGARSTPTVDGAKLYALGSNGNLACLEASTGEKVWKKDLRADFGGRPGWWAYSESPLVDGDVLVCTPGGEEATIVALNKQTGDVIWKNASPVKDHAGYASAIVAEIGGVKQYVQFLEKGVVGVDAKTGKFLWRYNETSKGSTASIPTPVEHGGSVLTGGPRGAGLVKVKAKGTEFEAEQVYLTKGLPSGIGGFVRVGDYLYGATGKGLVCAEFATGKVKWQHECVGAGAVCYADGRLYVRGDSGEVALVEATPDGYRENGRFTPPDQPAHPKGVKAWCYPVVADGRLYLRDLDRLWCYDVKDVK